jgi:hypothetical protein
LWKPARYFVQVILREKRACQNCEQSTVTMAPLEERIVEKGLASDNVVIDVVVSKYCDHLPLYRQAAILEREAGLEIGRATLDGWVMRVGEMLIPVTEAMRKALLSTPYLQADETTVPVQMHDRSGSNYEAYLWQYGKRGGETIFDFCLNRGREGPKKFLGKWEASCRLTATLLPALRRHAGLPLVDDSSSRFGQTLIPSSTTPWRERYAVRVLPIEMKPRTRRPNFRIALHCTPCVAGSDRSRVNDTGQLETLVATLVVTCCKLQANSIYRAVFLAITNTCRSPGAALLRVYLNDCIRLYRVRTVDTHTARRDVYTDSHVHSRNIVAAAGQPDGA